MMLDDRVRVSTLHGERQILARDPIQLMNQVRPESSATISPSISRTMDAGPTWSLLHLCARTLE
jgi:hypothetical protein